MITLKLARNFVEDYFKIRMNRTKHLKPLILAYFVTFRCNLKCVYCDYANNKLAQKYKELDTDKSIELLKLCSKDIPSIAFTGGEPLLRNDIAEIVRHAKIYNFKPISLFTNALLLPKNEEILKDIDYLQISLDSTDASIQDRLFGEPDSNITLKLLDIIRHYSKLQDKLKFRININTVICDSNLDGIIDVFNFAKENKIRMTICPELDNSGNDCKNFSTNVKYNETLDNLFELRAKYGVLMDTKEFLRHIYSFSSFDCYPWLSPRIFPNGELVAPCPVLDYKRYNVLEFNSLKELNVLISKDIGTDFECPKTCFLPCYLETSTLMVNPISSLLDIYNLQKLES
jgi:MoaA/NifB/PqqE/SkfB family radical SAM enzyme